MKQDVAADIERLLTYFSLAETQSTDAAISAVDDSEMHRLQRNWLLVPMTHFDEAVPFLGNLQQMVKDHDLRFFPPDEVKPTDIDTIDWDTRLIALPRGAEAEEAEKLSYAAWRVRRVPLSEIRGVFKLRTGVVVEYSQAKIDRSGNAATHREYVEWRGKNNWVVIGQPVACIEAPVQGNELSTIEVSKSIALTNYYEWRVALGYQGLPSISLYTDPTGAREAFRLRDIPNGRSRRAALRHWVETHWRKKQGGNSDVESTQVLAYLRGSTDFTWNGLTCKIKPSKYDLKRAERNNLMRQKATTA